MTAASEPLPGPILKWPGSKWRLAARIAGLLPMTRTYLEPFAGSAAVLLNLEPREFEVLNDLDGDICNLYRVLRDEGQRARLCELVAYTPWSREEYLLARDETDDPVERARRWLIRCWQGYGSRHVVTAGWRRMLGRGPCRGRGPQVWAGLPERIAVAGERLQGCYIERRPALQLLRDYSHAECAIYADPPYHPETMVDDRYYRHRMDGADHAELLELLDAHPGPVVLSGYRCRLYDDRLGRWERLDIPARVEGGRSKLESLWVKRGETWS